MAFLNLASAMNETGHYDEAKASTSRAIELLLPSAGERIDHPEESLLLILAQDNLAVAERELLNRLESSRIFDPAIARTSALNAKYSSPDIKRVLATVQNDLGELLAADPAQREAQAAFESARRELVALARAYPHIPGVRRDFAVACNGIGGAFIAIRRAEVESDPQKAKQHLESAWCIAKCAKVTCGSAQVTRVIRLRESARASSGKPREDRARTRKPRLGPHSLRRVRRRASEGNRSQRGESGRSKALGASHPGTRRIK